MKVQKKLSHFGLLDFKKDSKTIQWGKEEFFNKWFGENRTSICERMKVGTRSSHHLKKLTQVKYPNVKTFLSQKSGHEPASVAGASQ